jgi:hypothetical protein
MPPPSLEEFINAPIEQVLRVAPATAIYAAGGTRRSAALAGITPHTDEYANWLRGEMLSFMELLFSHGLRHVFAPTIISPNVVEFAHYRERFLGWVVQNLVGAEALADYARRGWRVRMIGTEGIPELQTAAAELVRATPPDWSRTLWWVASPTPEAPWDAALDTVASAGARTRAEAIRALYGEDIPLATLFISCGKPIAMYDLIPPLLVGKLQCYWVQRPGYQLDEHMIRSILYDYAYTRRIGEGVGSGERYAYIEAQHSTWETDAVLGLGQRLGPFWYPEPFPTMEGG